MLKRKGGIGHLVWGGKGHGGKGTFGVSLSSGLRGEWDLGKGVKKGGRSI